MFRREDMKAGQGSPQWLRLFQLMSAEIALAEGCGDAVVPEVRRQRIREITGLEKQLKAVRTLEDIRQAVRFIEEYVTDPSTPEYYLIEYDRSRGTVAVEPYSQPIKGISSFDAIEMANSQQGGNINAVLVEADSIENLRAAYPNYFGDVQKFKSALEELRACHRENLCCRHSRLRPSRHMKSLILVGLAEADSQNRRALKAIPYAVAAARSFET